VGLTDQPNQQQPEPKPVSAWVWAFRLLRWSTYLAAFVTLILLLHKSPAPVVEVSVQAANRAEQKMEAVTQSVSQGQQATLRLDETELNSYLATHLQLEGNDANPPASTPDAPDAPSAKDVEQVRSSVRDVKVQMQDDRVKAYVVFDLHGKDMTLKLEGKLGTKTVI
jgi:hypothetical protein